VLATVEEHRATWQFWHLWAETQRQLRGAVIHPPDLRDVAASVVEEAITQSVRLNPNDEPADLPPEERRADGASVFTMAGSTQYTSTRILAAEQHLMDAAALTDGAALEAVAVDVALAEAETTGTILDAGQKQMVRTVATDRRRVQLVLAPAGAGKTTALKVLADMWTAGGGHVLGLAPSAAAAAQLADATGTTADTLARLNWALDHQRPLPDWAERIGARTLLLIDEAGMADTRALDTAIGHTLRQGGRVCLVGDDQQLTAIGAGGILTDLQRTYGAVRLTRLHRFADPDEAAATLQVRDGSPDAVDFYSDRGRIRVGDPTGLPDQLLAAWQHDQQQGLDALMLTPARYQVADLNQHARAARLAGHRPMLEVDLADGNRASVDDLIITRRNDRRLTTGRDWVRNGDRWIVNALTPDGGIRALHRRTGKPVTLPADYVREAVELGYATTIHAAQGVTADTTHGLVDELMTREQLYTMVSRGRTANHLYLIMGGDGDLHGILHAEVGEPTAAELLQRVLSRSSFAASATTVRRQEQTAADVRRRLHAPRPTQELGYGRELVGRGPDAPAR